MKEIVITRSRIKKEIISLIAMFLIALSLNVIAIIAYHTNWSELITEMPFVLGITVVLYVFFTFLRIIVVLIRSAFN